MNRATKAAVLAMVILTAMFSLSGTWHVPSETASATDSPTVAPTATEITYEPVDPPVRATAPPTASATPKPTPIPPPAETEPTEPQEPPHSHSELEMLAKTVYGEAGICSTDEQRLVLWTIFQRVDADKWGDTISDVITAEWQFVGYSPDNPLDPDIYALCVEEYANWVNGAEPPTLEPYAPTAPYYFFDGDGWHNWYREEWR